MPMPQQKPSLGRIVHYRAASSKEVWSGADVHAAIVTRVWSDRCVNLKVLPDGGPVFDKTSVEIEDEPEQAGRWSWPPRV